LGVVAIQLIAVVLAGTSVLFPGMILTVIFIYVSVWRRPLE
jgi:hypothetical protein